MQFCIYLYAVLCHLFSQIIVSFHVLNPVKSVHWKKYCLLVNLMWFQGTGFNGPGSAPRVMLSMKFDTLSFPALLLNSTAVIWHPQFWHPHVFLLTHTWLGIRVGVSKLETSVWHSLWCQTSTLSFFGAQDCGGPWPRQQASGHSKAILTPVVAVGVPLILSFISWIHLSLTVYWPVGCLNVSGIIPVWLTLQTLPVNVSLCFHTLWSRIVLKSPVSVQAALMKVVTVATGSFLRPREAWDHMYLGGYCLGILQVVV